MKDTIQAMKLQRFEEDRFMLKKLTLDIEDMFVSCTTALNSEDIQIQSITSLQSHNIDAIIDPAAAQAGNENLTILILDADKNIKSGIYGDIIFVSSDECDNFISLDQNQINVLLDLLNTTSIYSTGEGQHYNLLSIIE